MQLSSIQRDLLIYKAVVAMGWGREKRSYLVGRVSVLQDENVLEIGCTTAGY
jgi:hypothetical protein